MGRSQRLLGAELPEACSRLCACIVTNSVCAEHILGLATSVFRVDSVLVWLAEGDRVFVRASCKAFPPGSRSACCHLLVPDKQVLVVEDTSQEPRCVNPCKCCAMCSVQ